MTETDAFYVESTSVWRYLANLHLEARGPTGALARALHTLVDAYEHARSESTRAEACQGCGRDNAVPWYAESRLWNEVVGGDADEEAAGFLCPSCFMAQADVHFTGTPWRVTGWRLVPDLTRVGAEL